MIARLLSSKYILKACVKDRVYRAAAAAGRGVGHLDAAGCEADLDSARPCCPTPCPLMQALLLLMLSAVVAMRAAMVEHAVALLWLPRYLSAKAALSGCVMRAVDCIDPCSP